MLNLMFGHEEDKSSIDWYSGNTCFCGGILDYSLLDCDGLSVHMPALRCESVNCYYPYIWGACLV